MGLLASDFDTQEDYRAVRLPQLLEEGVVEEDAEDLVSWEWRYQGKRRASSILEYRPKTSVVAAKTSAPPPKPKKARKRRARASSSTREREAVSKRNDVNFRYSERSNGVLQPEQARDAAIGLLQGLLEYADASDEQEYQILLQEGRELFGEDPPTMRDSEERQFGYDLAPYLVRLLMVRGVDWRELEPTALAWNRKQHEGQAVEARVPELPTFREPERLPGPLTPEQELGLAPRKQGSLGQTAVQATVRALQDIINQ